MIATGFGEIRRRREREEREPRESTENGTEAPRQGFDVPADILEVPCFLRDD